MATGLLMTIATLATMIIFQILSVQRTWGAEILATKELRSGGSAFAGDVLNAVSTTLADGTSTSTSASFFWAGVTNTTTLATYTLSSTTTPKDLVRELYVNGLKVGQKPVARNTVSVLFSRSGRTITLDLEVQASGDSTVSTTLNTYMRNSR